MSPWPSLLVALFLLAGPFQAQDTPDESAQRLKAAERLMEVTQMGESMQEWIDMELQDQLAASPEIRAFEDILQEFFHKHLTWEELQQPMTQAYAEAFTRQELEDLIAFYQTPTGRKSITILPQIYRRSSRAVQEIMQEHQAELVEAIQQRAEEMESGSQAPPAQRQSRQGSARITLALRDAEVVEINGEELTVLDRRGEEEVFALTEDSSFHDDNGFPVDDLLRDNEGQWEEGKLQELLPAGSKIHIQYFLRQDRKILSLVEKIP